MAGLRVQSIMVLSAILLLMHAPHASAASGSDVVRVISTPAGFAEALADPAVSTIVVSVLELKVIDADFVNGTILLRRNVSVEGDPALPDRPILRLLASKKVKIGAMVVLRFSRVSVYTPVRDNITRAPSWQILDRSEKGSQARLMTTNTILFSEACNPLSSRVSNVGQLLKVVSQAQAAGQLPADVPLDFIPGLNQTGCIRVNMSHPGSVPMTQRCWPDSALYMSFVTLGLELNNAGAPEPTNYIWVIQNQTTPCLRLADQACVDTYGPVGCNAWAISNLPALPIVAVDSSSAGDGSGEDASSGSSDSDVLAIALGCALGGAFLLAVIGGAIWWRATRQRRSRAAAAQEEKGAQAWPSGKQHSQREAEPAVAGGDGDGGGAVTLLIREGPPAAAAADAAGDGSRSGRKPAGMEWGPGSSAAGSTAAVGDELFEGRRRALAPGSGGNSGDAAAAGYAVAAGVTYVNKLGGDTAAAAEHPSTVSGSSILRDADAAGPPTAEAAGLRHTSTVPLLPDTDTAAAAAAAAVAGRATRSAAANVVDGCTAAADHRGRRASAHPQQQLPILPTDPYRADLDLGLNVNASDAATAALRSAEASSGTVEAALAMHAALYDSIASGGNSNATADSRAAPAADWGRGRPTPDAIRARGRAGSAPSGLQALPLPPLPPPPAGEAVVAASDGPTAVVTSATATAASASTAADRLGSSDASSACLASAVAAATPVQRASDELLPAQQALLQLQERASRQMESTAVGPLTYVSTILRTEFEAAEVDEDSNSARGAVGGGSLGEHEVGRQQVSEGSMIKGFSIGTAESTTRETTTPAAAEVDARTPSPEGAFPRATAAYVSGSAGGSADNTLHLLPVVRGRGGFGRVYEGMYRGQKVAVKMLVQGNEGAAGNTAALVKTLQQEVDVLGRCSHPNVVRLIAACLDPHQPCLVMELCETSLEALVFNRGGGEDRAAGTETAPPEQLMPLEQVLNVALGICSALSYMHPTITHRDLKPANVLLNNAASRMPEVKLTDFGLARIRATTMPTAEPEAGTAAYLAPECFDVNNAGAGITHRADLYSLGVCIWAMLTGEQPWRDYSMVAIAFKVCAKGERLPLDRIARHRCPYKLQQLIMALFDRDPRRRPAAEEAAKDIMLIQQQLNQGEELAQELQRMRQRRMQLT